MYYKKKIAAIQNKPQNRLKNNTAFTAQIIVRHLYARKVLQKNCIKTRHLKALHSLIAIPYESAREKTCCNQFVRNAWRILNGRRCYLRYLRRYLRRSLWYLRAERLSVIRDKISLNLYTKKLNYVENLVSNLRPIDKTSLKVSRV